MGSICCVAAKDMSHRTIRNVATDNPRSNNRYSPSLSFRWDNRGRVAGEDTSIHWFSDGMSCSDRSKIKYNAEFASGEESSLENTRHAWLKSPSSEGSAQSLRTHAPVRSISKNISADPGLEQVKEPAESGRDPYPCPAKLSHSFPATSSSSASPLSFQSSLPRNVSKPLRWTHHSPNSAPQQLRQVYDSQISGFKSPTSYSVSEDRRFPSWSNEFIGDLDEGSPTGWSMEGLSELIASSERGSLSFDSESSGFNCEKMGRARNQFSSSSSVELKTCGVCSKLLAERPPWINHKNVVNDISVVAVLTCGHVYHAPCLESLTPESSKYEPSCPICNVGEKQGLKLKEKALKSSSLSLRSSLGRPFLRKNFSFGSNRPFSMSHNQSRKKGFFWIKSTKTFSAILSGRKVLDKGTT